RNAVRCRDSGDVPDERLAAGDDEIRPSILDQAMCQLVGLPFLEVVVIGLRDIGCDVEKGHDESMDLELGRPLREGVAALEVVRGYRPAGGNAMTAPRRAVDHLGHGDRTTASVGWKRADVKEVEAVGHELRVAYRRSRTI